MQRNILGIALILMVSLTASSQYYYKDLITVAQTNAQWTLLKNGRVKSVRLQTFEGNNQPAEGLSVEQRVSDNRLITLTNSVENGKSELTSVYDPAGRIVQTTDTSEDFYSSTSYQYDASGRISAIENKSRSGEFLTTELHTWTYDEAGKPLTMLRIRNNTDTTHVTFVYDGKNVPVEEHAVRKGVRQPEYFYYYDDKNQLTDIVRYNIKARKMLPTHIFSYNADGRIAGMLLIPEGTNEYQRWYFDYDERGLKVRERILNKQQQLLGKVEYKYE